MADPKPAISRTIRLEGGLSERKEDPGGISKYGISLRFLNALSPATRKGYGLYSEPAIPDDIRSLTEGQAAEILEGEFWNRAPFAKISDQELADDIFDAAVSQGIGSAVKCVQRAIWAVWCGISILVDDGIFGHATLQWIETCKPMALLPAFRAERAWAYRKTVMDNPNLQVFLAGWLSRAYAK
jgi:lysozyme family protein